jgi:very-short-patch-repair endonuclease
MLKPTHTISAARTQLLRARAWENRRYQSEPERRLWQELRGGQLGVVFRRQLVLGERYIADFAAPALKLVVEVDGAIHARRRAADARRERDLGRLGYRVVRIPAGLVMGDVGAAVGLVRGALIGLWR